MSTGHQNAPQDQASSVCRHREKNGYQRSTCPGRGGGRGGTPLFSALTTHHAATSKNKQRWKTLAFAPSSLNPRAEKPNQHHTTPPTAPSDTSLSASPHYHPHGAVQHSTKSAPAHHRPPPPTAPSKTLTCQVWPAGKPSRPTPDTVPTCPADSPPQKPPRSPPPPPTAVCDRSPLPPLRLRRNRCVRRYRKPYTRGILGPRGLSNRLPAGVLRLPDRGLHKGGGRGDGGSKETKGEVEKKRKIHLCGRMDHGSLL